MANSAYTSVSSLLNESCINKSEIFIEANGKFDNSENSISEVKISLFNLELILPMIVSSILSPKR